MNRTPTTFERAAELQALATVYSDAVTTYFATEEMRNRAELDAAPSRLSRFSSTYRAAIAAVHTAQELGSVLVETINALGFDLDDRLGEAEGWDLIVEADGIGFLHLVYVPWGFVRTVTVAPVEAWVELLAADPSGLRVA